MHSNFYKLASDLLSCCLHIALFVVVPLNLVSVHFMNFIFSSLQGAHGIFCLDNALERNLRLRNTMIQSHTVSKDLNLGFPNPLFTTAISSHTVIYPILGTYLNLLKIIQEIGLRVDLIFLYV